MGGWHDSYAIGHPDIDQDHKILVDVITVLSQAYCERDLVDTQIKILERYIHDHFAREEELLRQSGFPDLEQHRSQHQSFIKRVQALRAHWAERDTAEMHASIAQELMDWMRDHILGDDRDYGPWLQGLVKAE